MSETTVVGDLRKMRVEEGDPILYTLPVGDESVAVNPLLGKTIGFRHTDNIHCIACGRKTGKSFNQGHCFPCFRDLARCDGCIVHPERCHYSTCFYPGAIRASMFFVGQESIPERRMQWKTSLAILSGHLSHRSG